MRFVKITAQVFTLALCLMLGVGRAIAQTVSAPLPAFCAHIPPPSQTLNGATSFTYRTIGARTLRIHVLSPETEDRRRPAVLLFFGGGFRVGDASSFATLAKALVAHGYVVALADYRVLCRDNVLTVGGVQDAEAALGWLRGQAAALGIDRKRIVMGGGSAGGLLAESAALRVPAAQRPAALVLFNPVLDLEHGLTAHDQSPTEAMAYSPRRLSLAEMPPTIIFHGTADHTVPIVSSRDFCARALAARRICQLVEYAGMDHSFADQHQVAAAIGASPFDDTLARTLAFLDKTLAPRERR